MHQSVVIVDDDKDQLKALGKFLDLLGVSYASADNAPTALSLIKQVDPKVVVMDIKMPGLSGIDAAKQIERKRLQYPKIILMSGYPELMREANIANLNVFAVIDKPVPLKVLGSFIQKVLSAGWAMGS